MKTDLNKQWQESKELAKVIYRFNYYAATYELMYILHLFVALNLYLITVSFVHTCTCT